MRSVRWCAAADIESSFPARVSPTRAGTTPYHDAMVEVSEDAGAAPRRPPSMADVAARVGVSHQTVSRVLNGSPLVREDTRDRVLAAIDELGYRRNNAARVLATNRSGRIGMVSAHLALHGPSMIAVAVQGAGHAAGLRRVAGRAARALRGVAARCGRAAARPGGRGDRRRGRSPRRARVGPLARPADPGGAGPGRHRRRADGRRHRPGTPAPRWPPPTCSTSGTSGSPTSTGPLDWVEAGQRRDGWREAHERRGVQPGRELPATGRRRAATTPGLRSPPTPTSPPCSSPTTRWRSACCGRCTSRSPGARAR